jgi:DNA-binding winged helix-turn-helix (wHTH) protein
MVLRPKTFDLLVYLVEHAGNLVTKDDLLAAVWPETLVAESALSVSVSELRKALGKTARAPQFIATVHRRGYRFIAPATPIDLSAPLASSMMLERTHAAFPDIAQMLVAERRQLTVWSALGLLGELEALNIRLTLPAGYQLAVRLGCNGIGRGEQGRHRRAPGTPSAR